MSESDLPLIVKYRPKTFAQVVGNTEVIKALVDVVREGPSRPHAFLLTGIAGIGKTSLALILAQELDASIIKYDAGCHTGQFVALSAANLAGFTSIEGRNRLFLVDEAQALTRKAWD